MFVLFLVLSVCFTASPIQSNLKLKQTNKALLKALRELTQEMAVGSPSGCIPCTCNIHHESTGQYSDCGDPSQFRMYGYDVATGDHSYITCYDLSTTGGAYVFRAFEVSGHCADSHYLVKGDPGDRTCHEITCDTILADNSEEHPPRCCSDTQITGWFQKAQCSVWAMSDCLDKNCHCQGPVNWDDANTFCRNQGGRLCTKDELEARCAEENLNCNYDNRLVWSSTDYSTGKEVRVGASYDPWYSGQCQQPELDRGCFYDELYTARCMCPRAMEHAVAETTVTCWKRTSYTSCTQSELDDGCETRYSQMYMYYSCHCVIPCKEERAVGGACDHITEANKSYECTPYYQNIKKCSICSDDGAGAVDNSAINSGVLDFDGFGN